MTANQSQPGLVALAEAGDPKAQYALAAHYSQTGDAELSDKWLQRAAKNGEPDALFTLSTRSLSTMANLPQGVADLGAAATAGSAPAHRLLSALYTEGVGADQNWKAAVDHVVSAAKAGDAGAMRDLALVLFAHDTDHISGQALIESASERDAAAAAICVLRFALGRKTTRQAPAARAFSTLQSIDYPRLQSLRAMLTPTNKRPDTLKDITPDWDAIAIDAAKQPSTASKEPEEISASPNIRLFRKALSPEECETAIAEGARRLAPSMIVDPETGAARRDPHRSSNTAILGIADLDLTLARINLRVSDLVGVPAQQGEFLSILQYRRGQEYKPHFDWLPAGLERDRSGQRIATALICLNEDYEGGETHFEQTGYKWKGETGDVLVFSNSSAGGEPDMTSRHAGLPVARGVKWLGSKWFRAQKYVF